LEDVLQIAGQFLEGGEGDGYVVVGFDSAGHDPLWSFRRLTSCEGSEVVEAAAGCRRRCLGVRRREAVHLTFDVDLDPADAGQHFEVLLGEAVTAQPY